MTNFADSNINIDIKKKLNFDDNITGKNNNTLCKNNLMTNIKIYFRKSKMKLLIKN